MSKFTELSKYKIAEGKNLISSITDEGNVSIAQQLVIQDMGKERGMFLKNSIIVDTDGLYAVKKLVDETIEKVEGIKASRTIKKSK